MTKEELMEYRKINIELTQLEEHIARLESAIKSPKGQIITDMPKGGQATGMEDKIIKLIEYRDSRDLLWDKLIAKQQKINNIIDSIPDSTQRTILRYRYILGLKWSDICLKTSYDERQIFRIHKKAIENISAKKDVSKCQ